MQMFGQQHLVCIAAWLYITIIHIYAESAISTIPPSTKTNMTTASVLHGCIYSGPKAIKHGKVLLTRGTSPNVHTEDLFSLADSASVILSPGDRILYVCEMSYHLKYFGKSVSVYRRSCLRLFVDDTLDIYYMSGKTVVGDHYACVQTASATASSKSETTCSEPYLRHGYVVSTSSSAIFHVGAHVSLQCNDGYHLSTGVRSAKVRCQVDGNWLDTEGKVPVCTSVEKRKCVLPHKDPHGSYNVSGSELGSDNTVDVDTVVIYFCDKGYSFVGHNTSSASEMSFCLASGEWLSQPPKCSALCSRPPDIPNGFWKPAATQHGHQKEQHYRYYCHADYILVGSSYYKCDMENHVWSPDTIPPQCWRNLRCNPPHAPPHGMYTPVKPHYAHGEMVVLECGEGYSVAGASTKQCEQNSSWSGGASGECMPVSACSAPAAIPNGWIITENDQHGHMLVRYFCNDRYTLVGSQTRTCMSGLWTVGQPYCQRQYSGWFSSNVVNKTLVISITTSVIILLAFVVTMSFVQRRCFRTVRNSIYPPQHRRCFPLWDDVEDDVSTLMAIQGCPPSYSDAMTNTVCPPDEVPTYEQAIGSHNEPLISFPPESPVPPYDEAVQADHPSGYAILINMAAVDDDDDLIESIHGEDEPLLVG
ncbi:PREDICTED: coagulation factor XIII B chain-like [Priapulus caudatus]|uniref:Coagulation factor XIII B chain-like n=1 Tax=Priapulus caudatus TaxID=37621 RepID=A0ABM1E2Z7_PRICU|nr:PREDICTED: coagulation factor XIII B chain-like [Priapulus caudatus]XP_014666568.1 PREDICTED: coagulation factor XIII B chain-like [Priapulus caudatus]XP_014666569.1 PREDICTED: coagulation factor XIII B chain-like [Priapulus caudatus]XP_014666570.1 PREDICTED: coagulation factor XIII B chain-like [Priapulus caudatus]XP_014666571.1 PREDICTED: coagulation factor XIII B chain-like [Priapulus caudatus]